MLNSFASLDLTLVILIKPSRVASQQNNCSLLALQV